MADLAPGTVFAGCRIEGIAGRGGMGVVYEATDLRLDRSVALKLIAFGQSRDREFRERFERESRLAASIDHPNIIPVYAAGEHEGQPYLVMRFVRGTDLQDVLHDSGRLSPQRAAKVIAQVAAALDAAHAAGLVHRDVKPANVLLDGTHVYLTDFGLTRLAGSDTRITETGRWMGTVDFASPEQLQAGRTDARSDVYALGCVLYATLTGQAPFVRKTVPAAIYAHLHEQPPRVGDRGVPEAFDRILERALAKAPEDRYPSAGDLGRAALAAAAGQRITTEERTVATGIAAPSAGETRVLAPDPPAPPTPRLVPDAAPHREETKVLTPQHRDETKALPVEEQTVAFPPRRDEPPRKAAPKPAKEQEPPADPVSNGRRRRSAPLALGVLAVAGLGVVAALAIAGAGGSGPPPAVEPVTEDEVRSAVDRFARAYSDEDPKALGRLLTADVKRVLPGGVQQGRAAVVGEYAKQFRTMQIVRYEVSDLEVAAGDAGRAEGTYTVRRRKASPFGGGFVLGVIKEKGRVRVRLIAATPT